MKNNHLYSEEEIQFLRDNANGITLKELTKKFNEHFNLNISADCIKASKSRYKIYSNYFPSRFKKGMKPTRTTFKKGQPSIKRKPIGAEWVSSDGFVIIKTAQPDVWERKHRVIYQQHFGKINNDETVIFLDGNKRNFDIDNLCLLTRQELLVFNCMHSNAKDKEIKKTYALLSKTICAIMNKKKKLDV